MAVTEETRKRLWGRSGNICFLCREPLIRRDEPGEPGALVGQEAHIIGRSPGGPRYEPLNPAERDGYNNLVLVCANDHREIDTQPDRYPVERLWELKAAHEAWVAQRLTAPTKTPSGILKTWVMLSGDGLWDLIYGSMAYDFESPRSLSDDQAVLIDDFLQLAHDYGEVSSDILDSGFRAVRKAKRELQEQLVALNAAGFVVLGGKAKAAFGLEKPTILPVTVLRVVRPSEIEQFAKVTDQD